MILEVKLRKSGGGGWFECFSFDLAHDRSGDEHHWHGAAEIRRH
jgi:hypothetical protein